MSNYYDNPYNSPERHGLTIVFDDDIGGSYEFDMFVVWRSMNGTLFTAADSGCSCPSPFEDIKAVGDLLEHNSKDSVIEEYEEWLAENEYRLDSDRITRDTQPLMVALDKASS